MGTGVNELSIVNRTTNLTAAGSSGTKFLSIDVTLGTTITFSSSANENAVSIKSSVNFGTSALLNVYLLDNNSTANAAVMAASSNFTDFSAGPTLEVKTT